MRLTPLNLVCAGLVVSIMWPFISNEPQSAPNNIYFFVGLVIITSVADIIFRALLKDNQKVWITEGLFTLLVFTLMLLFGVYK